MRNVKNIILVFGIISITLVVGIQTNKITSTCENLAILKIINAVYGDFDQDNYLDDIKIESILKTTYPDSFRAFLYLSLILPSESIISFSFEINLNSANSVIKITIITYNTAIEEGWYTAKLIGVFIFGEYITITSSTNTFDPPTENGPGEPTAEIFIT